MIVLLGKELETDESAVDASIGVLVAAIEELGEYVVVEALDSVLLPIVEIVALKGEAEEGVTIVEVAVLLVGIEVVDAKLVVVRGVVVVVATVEVEEWVMRF